MSSYIENIINSIFGSPNVSESYSSILFGYPCKNLNNCTNYEVSLKPATYKIECWGASGIDSRGAYTRGFIELKEQTKLFLYIGQNKGFYNSVPANATIRLGVPAGGSTDVRLIDGDFYDFNSLKSRIMVSASGGSWENRFSTPAHAGDLSSISTNTYYSLNDDSGSIIFTLNGANQTSPGYQSYRTYYYSDIGRPGTFGIAGYTTNASEDWGAIGGNGYYAGCSTTNNGGSTGGSSFISGHPGCDAISNESSSFENIIHTGQPIHYSNLSFFNTLMINGQNKMPLPWFHYKLKKDPINENYYETGHKGHGFVRITLFDEAIFISCRLLYHSYNINIFPLFVFILLFSK